MNKISKQRLPKIGEVIRVWFSSPQGIGKAKVLAIFPYDGTLTQFYTHIIRLSSNSNRDWTDIAWNKDNWIYMWHINGYYKQFYE